MASNVKVDRFCGNCGSHNLYEYPLRMFCSTRFDKGKNPIVETLWCCDDWNEVSQECYCVREASRLKKRKHSRR